MNGNIGTIGWEDLLLLKRQAVTLPALSSQNTCGEG